MFRITKLNNYYNKFRSFKRKNIISITDNDNVLIDKSKNQQDDQLKVTLQIIKDDECWRTKNWFELKFDEEIDSTRNLELLKEIEKDLNNNNNINNNNNNNINNNNSISSNEESEINNNKLNKSISKTILNIEKEIEVEEKSKIKLLRVKKIEIFKKEDNSFNEDFSDISDDITDKEIEDLSTSTSTYSKGKRYELKTIEILNEFGMDIIRSGGRDDKGIDFKGNWNLPSNKIVKIIGQCKNYSGKKVGPSVIREFESTFLRYQSELDKENSKLLKQDKTSTLGIIVSQSGFSPSIRSFLEEIQYPIVLCHLLDEGILSFYLNFNAKQLLPNIRVARRKNLETGQFTLDLAYDNN
ncbi:hypothetical protein ACTFIU_000646 [Dictyostelium citrinum]